MNQSKSIGLIVLVLAALFPAASAIAATSRPGPGRPPPLRCASSAVSRFESGGTDLCTGFGRVKILVVLAQVAGLEPAERLRSDWEDIFFGQREGTVRDYYERVSRGRVHLEGRVTDWIQVPSGINLAKPSELYQEVIGRVPSDYLADDYADWLVIYREPFPTHYAYGQLAKRCGRESYGSGDNVIDAEPSLIWIRDAAVTNPLQAAQLAVHELGHHFGLEHSNLYVGSSTQLFPPLGSVERGLEYGNPLTPMGLWSLGSFSAFDLARLDWLPPGGVKEVGKSGEYYLDPVASPVALLDPNLDARQPVALRIVRKAAGKPTSRLWIEARSPTGLDANSAFLQDQLPRAYIYHEGSAQAASLIDLTPGSDGEGRDANLVSDHEYLEPETGLRLRASPAGDGVWVRVDFE